MRRLRASFDKPTVLGLMGGISLPVGVGVIAGPGAGLVIFGLECLTVAVLDATKRR